MFSRSSCAHCIVLGGVRIGAHSLVTRDIPTYSVDYGSPAKFVDLENLSEYEFK